MNDLIYKSLQTDSKPCEPSLAVKFCQDTYLTLNFLLDRGIPFHSSELEKSPMGWVLRIKKENNDEIQT